MALNSKKIALLGGCFDPITNGHLNSAIQLLESNLYVDEVWFLITYKSLYGKNLSDPIHRINMCQLAIENLNNKWQDKIKVCTYEVDNKIVQESYDVIHGFLNYYSNIDYSFYFVIGMDNANTISTWKRWQDLINMIPFIVIPRGEYKKDILVSWYNNPPHIFIDSIEEYTSSSTIIRNKIRNGLSIDGLTPDSVIEYIYKNNLTF